MKAGVRFSHKCELTFHIHRGSTVILCLAGCGYSRTRTRMGNPVFDVSGEFPGQTDGQKLRPNSDNGEVGQCNKNVSRMYSVVLF